MNKGDLISRKALEEALKRTKIRLGFDKSRMFGLIEKAPAVDAVAVVRCKDCVHRAEYLGSGLFVCIRTQCTVCGHNVFVAEDDFCSRGERRSE